MEWHPVQRETPVLQRERTRTDRLSVSVGEPLGDEEIYRDISDFLWKWIKLGVAI